MRMGRKVCSQVTTSVPASTIVNPLAPAAVAKAPMRSYFQTAHILSKNFYVIVKGCQPHDNGIYYSWAKVSSRVTKVSGAIHQSFKTYEEAHAFWLTGTQELINQG